MQQTSQKPQTINISASLNRPAWTSGREEVLEVLTDTPTLTVRRVKWYGGLNAHRFMSTRNGLKKIRKLYAYYGKGN